MTNKGQRRQGKKDSSLKWQILRKTKIICTEIKARNECKEKEDKEKQKWSSKVRYYNTKIWRLIKGLKQLEQMYHFRLLSNCREKESIRLIY